MPSLSLPGEGGAVVVAGSVVREQQQLQQLQQQMNTWTNETNVTGAKQSAARSSAMPPAIPTNATATSSPASVHQAPLGLQQVSEELSEGPPRVVQLFPFVIPKIEGYLHSAATHFQKVRARLFLARSLFLSLSLSLPPSPSLSLSHTLAHVSTSPSLPPSLSLSLSLFFLSPFSLLFLSFPSFTLLMYAG